MWRKFFQDAASNFFVSRSLFNSNKIKRIINGVTVYYLGVACLIEVCNISNMRDSVLSGYSNTEKRVENRTHSGVFFMKIRVAKTKE